MEAWRKTRTIGGHVLWALCSLAALVLALGVLLVVFQADPRHGLVKSVLHVADVVDLGIFDRAHGIKQWTSENAQTKNALFNWGLGALAWIILGRLVDRFVRPTVTVK